MFKNTPYSRLLDHIQFQKVSVRHPANGERTLAFYYAEQLLHESVTLVRTK